MYFCLLSHDSPTFWSRKQKKISVMTGRKEHRSFIGFYIPSSLFSRLNTHAALGAQRDSFSGDKSKPTTSISWGPTPDSAQGQGQHLHLTAPCLLPDLFNHSSDGNISPSSGYHWRSWPGEFIVYPRRGYSGWWLTRLNKPTGDSSFHKVLHVWSCINKCGNFSLVLSAQ